MIWKQVLYIQLFGFAWFNGPVKNALFCLMDRYRNVCVWLMARNCRFPKVGTHGCQRGNHRLPFQGTAGSQRLGLLVPNLATMGYHCKQLPVTRGWNSCFPTWEPSATIATNFRFLKVGTDGSQRGNHRLPWQGTAGSQTLKLTVPNLGTTGYHCKELPQKLEFMFSKLSNYHCKELPVAKAWKSWFQTFQTWKSIRYQWKDLLIPKR